MRFVSHPDPRVLIGWLRRDIDTRRAGDPLRPIFVLAPNRRLAGALRRWLTDAGRAHVNLRVLDLWALASELGDAGPDGGMPRRVAPELLLRRVVCGCLERAGGRLAREAVRRPGTVAHLLATFHEMREAGVSEPDASRLLRECGDAPVSETLRAYLRYLAALRELGRSGWVDRAGFVEHALERAGGGAPGAAAAYLYGAYEILGVHVSLLRALSSGADLAVLLPLAREGSAWAHGRRFADAFLRAPGEEIEFLGDPAATPWSRAARALYDEEAAGPPPLEGGALEVFHSQGIEAELCGVARRVLDMHRSGRPLDRIGVVARTLEAYAPHLARVFDAHGIPFSTSATQPLSRFPAALALLALLRTLARDFERDDLLALLRSPGVRWPEGARPRPDLLERWSGEAGIRKGLAAWVEDLPEWVREQIHEAERRSFDDPREGEAYRAARERALDEQMSALRALGREAAAWSACAGLAAHAGFVRALAGRWIEGFESGAERDPVMRAIGEAIDEMGAAGGSETAGEGGAGGPASALDLLEGQVLGRRLSLRDEERGGVRVLDGMQARGHVFDVLFLVGFNAGAFPLRLGEDPFLPEARRLWLREEARRPVPLRRNLDEERLLLALWLSSADGRVVVSYRRADEDGRAEVPSFALRELARLALGRPDAPALVRSAVPVPVHPQRRILHWMDATGLVSPDEAALLEALEPGNRAARARECLARAGRLVEPADTGLRWMQGLERRWLEEEGRCGAPGALLPAAWSPTRLEQMARCPLQFFFERVLAVEVLPGPPEDGVFDPRDWGRRVHALLEEVFRTLGRESLLEPDAGPLRDGEERRCRDLVEGAWEEHFGDLGRRVSRRLALLWDLRAERWRQALAGTVLREVRLWRERGLTLVELEGEGEVALGAGPDGKEVPLVLRGRMDRVARLSGGPDGTRRTLITDYKVGRGLESLGEGREILRGLRLQAPVYAWIEAARPGEEAAPVDVEFLGVGPDHEEDPEGARVEVAAADLDRWRPGVEETVRTLARLAAEGRFPLRHEDRQCGWCGYEAACHHLEPEAGRGVKSDPGHADYFDTHRKVRRAPTLAGVRGPGSGA